MQLGLLAAAGFATVLLAAPLAQYLATNAQLRVVVMSAETAARYEEAKRADLTDDGQVEALDLALWVSAFRSGDARADIDGDGISGVEDLSLLLDAFGESTAP